MTKSQKTTVEIVVPPTVRPRIEFGSDWGRQRKVLVRYGKKEIQLVPGQPCWAGVGCRWQYHAQHIILMDYGGGTFRNCPKQKDLGLEGRLSAKRWLEFQSQVEEFLGIKFPEIVQVSPKHTVEITRV